MDENAIKGKMRENKINAILFSVLLLTCFGCNGIFVYIRVELY